MADITSFFISTARFIIPIKEKFLLYFYFMGYLKLMFKNEVSFVHSEMYRS